MSEEYDDELRGVLFPELGEKKSDRHPDFTGSVTVEGVEYRIAAWKRKSKKDKPFLSLTLSEKTVTPVEDIDPEGALEI